MKQTINGCLIFIISVIVGIVVMLIVGSFTKNEETVMFWIRLVMGIFVLCALMFKTRRYVKKKM